MSKKARPLFGRQRLISPSSRKRLDLGIIIVGLIVALVLGVLTWINYQDREIPGEATGAPLPLANKTPKEQLQAL